MEKRTRLIGAISPVAFLVACGGGALPFDSAWAQALAAPPETAQAGGVSASSQQNDQLESIVVTARKRPEDIQDVPMAVSAISGAALERRGIEDVKDLIETVPSLAFVQQNSARTSYLQIRGIGSSGLNPGIEPSVGVYFDGAYQKQATSVVGTKFLDLEDIEVLRGPQGTLYGRNTPVGAVIVRSVAPTDTFEAMTQVGAGDYGNQYVQSYVGGGIAKDVAARLSVYAGQMSGYDRNLADGSQVNGENEAGARLRVRWTPSSDFTGDLIGSYSYSHANCCSADDVNPTGHGGIASAGFLSAIQSATGRPFDNYTGKDHVVDDAEFPVENVHNFGVQFNGEEKLNDDLTLTSISVYSGTRVFVPRSASANQQLVPIQTSNHTGTDTYSEEVRLTGDAGGAISYQAGFYLYDENTDYSEVRTTVAPNRVFADGLVLPPGLQYHFNFAQSTFSASGYGQATWNITDELRLTGGARYSYDQKSADISGVNTQGAPTDFTASFPAYNLVDQKYSESKPTYLVSLQYDIARDVMVYFTDSTGWKSGGFNGRPNPVGSPISFGPEDAQNYEVGLKSRFLDRKLQVNLSLYELSDKGFQDSVLNPKTGVGFIVGNAGTYNSRGAEWDVQYRPIRPLTLFTTGSYLDGYFSDDTAAPCSTYAVPNGSSPGTCNFNGRTPAYSPKWSFDVGVEYTHPIPSTDLEAFINSDVHYVAGQYTYSTLDPRSYQDGYGLVNARAGIQEPGGRWRLSIWGKNLNNATYWTSTSSVANNTFLSNGGRTAVTTPLIGWTGAPRTFGVEGTYRF